MDDLNKILKKWKQPIWSKYVLRAHSKCSKCTCMGTPTPTPTQGPWWNPMSVHYHSAGLPTGHRYLQNPRKVVKPPASPWGCLLHIFQMIKEGVPRIQWGWNQRTGREGTTSSWCNWVDSSHKWRGQRRMVGDEKNQTLIPERGVNWKKEHR